MASSDTSVVEHLGPWSRLLIVLSLVGSFAIARDTEAALASSFLLAVIGFIVNRQPTMHVLTFVVMPFAACTAIVAAIVGSGDGRELAQAAVEQAVSWQAYAGRFATLSGVCLSVSLMLGSLTPNGVCKWLSFLGLPKQMCFQAASPLVLIVALRCQLHTILDARHAYGFVGRRSFVSNARQLVPVLTLLVSTGLTMAVERAELWQQDDIMSLIEADRQEGRSMKFQWPIEIGAWLLAAIVFLTNLVWRGGIVRDI